LTGFDLPTHAELAAKLLDDAAAFFRSLGEQNAPLREQMRENADVFAQMGALLRDNPLGSIEDDGAKPPGTAAPDTGAPAFQARAPFVHGLCAHGDRLEFRHATARWQPCPEQDARIMRQAFAADLSEQDRSLLDRAEIWRMTPPFYAGATLYHALVPGEGGSDGFFLEYPALAEQAGDIERAAIRFGSTPIHAANARAPLLLDGAEYDYLLFFMHLVRASRGTFRVLTERNIDAVRQILTEAGETQAAAALRTPEFQHFDAAGACLYQAHVVYGGAVFRATLRVFPTGMVEMPEDEPLCETVASLVEIEAPDDETETE